MEFEADKQVVDFNNRLYVRIEKHHETHSFNLGERHYFAEKSYAVDKHMLKEIIESGNGVQLTKDNCPFNEELQIRVVPEIFLVSRPMISVLPNITKKFTANGIDTYNAIENVSIDVPSNLSAYLIANNLANLPTKSNGE